MARYAMGINGEAWVEKGLSPFVTLKFRLLFLLENTKSVLEIGVGYAKLMKDHVTDKLPWYQSMGRL